MRKKVTLVAALAVSIIATPVLANNNQNSGATVNNSNGPRNITTNNNTTNNYTTTNNPTATATSTSGATATNRTNVVANPTATANGGSARATGGSAVANGGAGGQGGAGGAGGQGGRGGQGGVGNGGQGGVGNGGSSNVSVAGPSTPGTQTIRNTPEVNPPAIVGTNPCAVGISAGMSLPGFGVGGGYSYSDTGCERRATAALAFSTGQQALGREIMCDDPAVRAARRRLGDLCMEDQQEAARQAAEAARRTPAAVPVSAPAPAPVARPAYCAERPNESMADLMMRLANCGQR